MKLYCLPKCENDKPFQTKLKEKKVDWIYFCDVTKQFIRGIFF